RINGTALSPAAYRQLGELVTKTLARLPPPADPAEYISPSALYLLAGAAFLLERCDVIVLEAGIGGASDELSLLGLGHLAATAVFAEHADLLGPTVQAIATDKLAAAGPSTTGIVHLDDAGPLAAAARRQASHLGIKAHAVCTSPGAPGQVMLPPGLGGGNALVGIATGQLVAEALGAGPPPAEALAQTLATVRHPGRCSVHSTSNGDQVVVDSPVTAPGLAAALDFARGVFGGQPNLILASLPEGKDLDGFGQLLAPLGRKVVWIEPTGTHLQYGPTPPWAQPATAPLPDLLAGDRVLAVGTALFTGQVLAALDVPTASLFTPITRGEDSGQFRLGPGIGWGVVACGACCAL
ncbi:MAG: hypothetical protein LBH48_08555, partial [Bifidobacteriaceae bacterium]|nr:hypothetical protein [Bifidobacteriaceae bacterium]